MTENEKHHQKTTKLEINQLTPFPAGSEPYNHDYERRGSDITDEILGMHHIQENVVILVDRVTGMRVEVVFPR